MPQLELKAGREVGPWPQHLAGNGAAHAGKGLARDLRLARSRLDEMAMSGVVLVGEMEDLKGF